MVKKFDEIKEAISATSTPVKNKEREQRLGYGMSHESLDSLTDGSQQDRNEITSRITGDFFIFKIFWFSSFEFKV